jgi:hypothetical protein
VARPRRCSRHPSRAEIVKHSAEHVATTRKVSSVIWCPPASTHARDAALPRVFIVPPLENLTRLHLPPPPRRVRFPPTQIRRPTTSARGQGSELLIRFEMNPE